MRFDVLVSLFRVASFVVAIYAMPSPVLAHRGGGAADVPTVSAPEIGNAAPVFSSSTMASPEATRSAPCDDGGGCSGGAACCALIIPYVPPLIFQPSRAPNFVRLSDDIRGGVVPNVYRRPPRTFA